jgi:hypothetical protein
MPSLIIENMPPPLFDQIQRLAAAQKRTLADTAVEVLETAFRTKSATRCEQPLPQAMFLTAEICAPFTLPRPKGESVVPIDIAHYVPDPHDLPDTE